MTYRFNKRLLAVCALAVGQRGTARNPVLDGLFFDGRRIVGASPYFVTIAFDGSTSAEKNPSAVGGVMADRYASVLMSQEISAELKSKRKIDSNESWTIKLGKKEIKWFGEHGEFSFTGILAQRDVCYPNYPQTVRAAMHGISLKRKTNNPVCLGSHVLKQIMNTDAVLYDRVYNDVDRQHVYALYGTPDGYIVRYHFPEDNGTYSIRSDIFSMVTGFEPGVKPSGKLSVVDVLPSFMLRKKEEK